MYTTDFLNSATSDTPVKEETHVSSKVDTKTNYRGVFVNTHKNKDHFKFRVSIAQSGNRDSGTFWKNLGYYNCKETAGLVYNIHALNVYMGKAKLNKVDKSVADLEEVHIMLAKHALRAKIAKLVVKAVEDAGEELVYL